MDKELNHYGVLGIRCDADDEKIKQAYRTAARKHHPDSETGDSASFRRIQEAYEVLSDKTLRSEYDKSTGDINSTTAAWRHPPTRGYSHPSLFDAFVNLFSSEGFTTPLNARQSPYMDLILTPEEASAGGTIPVQIPVERVCSRCYGAGCIDCRGFGTWTAATDLGEGWHNPGSLHITVVVE